MPASTQLYQNPHLWLLTDPGNPQSLLWLLIRVPASWRWLRASATGGSQGPLLPPASFPIISYGGRTLNEAHTPNSVNPITAPTLFLVHPAARKKVKTRSFICVSAETVSYSTSQALQLPRSLAQVGMNLGQSSYLVAGLVLLKQGLTYSSGYTQPTM